MVKEKSFYKQFFGLFSFLVFQNVIVLAVNLADNVMVGSYSETALSGVAAVNQIQFVYLQITMALGDTLVVLGSQYWGKGRTNEIKKLAASAAATAVFIGFLLFVAALLFPYGIVHLFTDSEDIIAEGVKYLQLIKFTYLVYALTNVLLASMRSTENVKIAFYVSLSTLVINCSINYLLINGNLGFPKLGVTGAAVGTLSARIVELIIVMLYIFLADKKLHIKPRDFIKPDREFFGDYLKTSVNFIVTAALFGVATAMQTVILGHMQDSAIAANSIANALYQLTKVAFVGASSAASVMIGIAIGKEDLKSVREYAKTLQIIFLIIGAVMSVSLYFLRIPFLGMYSLSDETYRLANGFIIVLCFTGMGTAYEMPVLCGIVRGGGDSRFLVINDFISIWLIVLPLSYLAAFVFKWSPIAVVLCLNSDQIFKCAAAAIKCNSFTWIKKLTKDENTLIKQ
ncbi:MAG: MATE family efflux transporter [Clostridia bacterium]|nr:MATE family efflux transporter [Clostridia bacterium]